MFAIKALVVATVASTLADFVWFYAGRRFGRQVLTLLCRISISPDSCVRKNELSFARRGVVTLVIAKFVPGLGTVAPPLAGSLGMRASPFALFTATGAALWAGAGIAAGVIFHDQIQHLLEFLGDLGRMAGWLVAALVTLYIIWRAGRRWHDLRLHARTPKVLSADLAEMIERGSQPLILDVRSQGPDLPLRERIPGARHIDLATIDMVPLTNWPDGVPIVIYCDCPNDASATKAAGLLARRGIAASILSGGMGAWVQAGYPLEAV